MATYTTITGRRFDLTQLSSRERAFLGQIEALYRRRPAWDEFSAAWIAQARRALWTDGSIPVGSPVYRICQDLAARLGIAEGRLARPDYRDRLADLIEERFGSRYRFCNATGIDQAHLSRVLTGKKHLAPDALARALDALQVDLAFVDRAELGEIAPLDLSSPGLSGGSKARNGRWVRTVRDEAGRITAWLARGAEMLLFPAPRLATEFASRRAGADDGGRDDVEAAPAHPTARALLWRSAEPIWQAVARPASGGGTVVQVTPMDEPIDDPSAVYEGWSIRLVVGRRRRGPRLTDSAGLALFEDLPFDSDMLSQARLEIAPPAPIAPAEPP